MEYIDVIEGRSLFGLDARGYGDIRPQYPEEIYRFLTETGALRAGAATLEIGAGSGLATRRLLEAGVDPLTIVEPDARFATQIGALVSLFDARCRLLVESFEEVAVVDGSLDLVCAATAFHWLSRATAWRKISRVLRPGGYVALWWNVFGDPEREDRFHEATTGLLSPLPVSPSGAPDATPYALDVEARVADIVNTGAFEAPVHLLHKWTLRLDAEGVAALYGTFSSINRLDSEARSTVLSALKRIARVEFGGSVERNMVSVAYVARRR